MINRKSSVSNLLVDTVHNIYYCPIPKVGSTFWKRILTVFSSKGRLKSPYDITLRGVKLKQTKIWRKNQIQDWEENESFIFVREPYARLFSGYENKIYHPNKIFWKKIGAKIVNKYRNLTKKVEFGYDVTFPELVREIVDTHEKGGSINGHFTLMSEHCNPCQTDFKYIGHLETIADDSEYLLTRWRHKFNDVTLKFNDLHKEAGYDTARGHVRDLFATHSIIPETFPFRNMMLRTWRDLQMRGYISKYTEFPYTGDINNVTSEEFMQQMKYTISKAQNRTALKLQRHEALVQAYSQVPIKDMERLRQYLLPDCLLFGYDDRPAALFNRSKPLNVDFLYLDGLTSDTKK
ncbi:Carbohydrate sulfotransferase 12 [Mactra antiquata]